MAMHRRASRPKCHCGTALVAGCGLIAALRTVLLPSMLGQFDDTLSGFVRMPRGDVKRAVLLGRAASLGPEVEEKPPVDTVESDTEDMASGTVWVNRPEKRSFEVSWKSGDTVGDLKKVIKEATKIPLDMQELRSKGVEMHPDDMSMEDWALTNGGVTATAGGVGPDIWLFDSRSEEERAAVDPPQGYYDDEDEGLDAFRIAFYVVFILPLIVYVGAQIAGVNPLVQQTPDNIEYAYIDQDEFGPLYSSFISGRESPPAVTSPAPAPAPADQ